MQGRRARSRVSAAATLAAIMNSSIRRWLSRRWRGSIAAHLALLVEQDAPLRQIEIQGAAALARGQQRAEGAIERLDHRVDQRRRRLVRHVRRAAAWTWS